ncbi:DUF6090 family protein [Winogradskyella tangerina]|uniref:DUF6090 family protein n=1 Tax=Winogradskyella tangerina TaxID=2023240 RepID=UPI0013009286|nr:DUF6090 family protein [Winogradskyella tangerina]
MIKFFRKIRQRLLSENKFSKYLLYALGEIILVVIGILIALQVNNSNENRKNRAKERLFLNQLHNDFKKNQLALTSYKEQYKINTSYLDVILRHTGPKVAVPSVKVFDSIQNLYTPRVELLYSTDETQSGLNFDLLSNSSLVQTIKQLPIVFKLYHTHESGMTDLVIQQRKIHQQYVPLIVQESDKYPQEHFEVDSLGLLRNREFQNITVDRLWVSNSAKRTLNYVEKFNDSIINLIEFELKKYD